MSGGFWYPGYPRVCDEWETLKWLNAGYSIARYGDGELKLMDGEGYIREPASRSLAHELKKVMRTPHEKCLIGIPTMDPKGPKFENSWQGRKVRFAKVLPIGMMYFSAFISRPDSAPRINTSEFAREYQKLWLGKHAVVVCEAKGSAMRAVRLGAGKITYIECPRFNAYSTIALLERSIRAIAPDIAILSCGPTATCLANRLAHRGIQAIDFGSGGKFIANLLDD